MRPQPRWRPGSRRSFTRSSRRVGERASNSAGTRCLPSSGRPARRSGRRPTSSPRSSRRRSPIRRLPLPVGIGLDAGEAVRVEDGYRGGALNLAARLCALAGPGEILASQEVVHLARRIEGVTQVDRGSVRLKGLADSVRVIRLTRDGWDPEHDVEFRRALGSRRIRPLLPGRTSVRTGAWPRSSPRTRTGSSGGRGSSPTSSPGSTVSACCS